MKQSRDLPYLLHIKEATERIEQYVRGLDRQSFDDDVLIQDGVIRQLMVIGEAVKLLSEELRSRYPAVPWRQIARMRDRLVHRYFGIDLETVWLTVQEDIPVLRREIGAIFSNEEVNSPKVKGDVD
jgi:uncharacterized protein with HEPN domain